MLTIDTLMPYIEALLFSEVPQLQILGSTINSKQTAVWVRGNSTGCKDAANQSPFHNSTA